MENREILDMRNITKDFSGVKALDNCQILDETSFPVVLLTIVNLFPGSGAII